MTYTDPRASPLHLAHLAAIMAIDWSAPCPIAEGERLARADAEGRRERERVIELADSKAKAKEQRRKAG